MLAAIRPAHASREIIELTQQLENLALAKALTPIKPPVNHAFNHRTEPEIPNDATNQPWRRIDMRQQATTYLRGSEKRQDTLAAAQPESKASYCCIL